MLSYFSASLKRANVPKSIREYAILFFMCSCAVYIEGAILMYSGIIEGLFIALPAIPTIVLYPVKCWMNLSEILNPLYEIDDKHPFLSQYEVKKMAKELSVYYGLVNENNVKLRKFRK